MFPVETSVLFESGRRTAPGSEPLVSVVVTLFNYGRHLDGCLGSVLAQTHRRLELIVIDDASTDASAALARDWLKKHAARFERAVLVGHARNQGLSTARNTGFQAARAEHVFVLDADNAIYPRAIARLSEAMGNGDFGLAYSQLEFFGDLQRLGYADIWERELFKPANYVDAMALVSKARWAEVGGYRQFDLGWEDFDLWLRFLERGVRGVFVPEILCRYRVHGASMLRKDTDLNKIRIVDRFSVMYPWLRLLEA